MMCICKMPTRTRKHTHTNDLDDDEEEAQFKREQTLIIELKDKVKNEILNHLIHVVDVSLDRLVDKIIDDHDDDDTKNIMFVSTTHDYPCSKCSNNRSFEDITSMSKILNENKHLILGDVGDFITRYLEGDK